MNPELKALIEAKTEEHKQQCLADYRLAEEMCVLLNELRDIYDTYTALRPEETRDRWIVGGFGSPYIYFAYWSFFNKWQKHGTHSVRISEGKIYVYSTDGKLVGEPESAVEAAAMAYDYKIQNDAHQQVNASRITN